MRIVNKTIKFGDGSAKLYYEQFSSYDEYWRIVEEREKTNAHCISRNLDNICNDYSWVGCKSYDEAKNLLVNGWDAKVDYFKDMVKKEVDLISDKKVSKIYVDFVGFMPLVANAVMNLPMCMLNKKQDIKKSKIIKFLIGMNRSFNYEPKEIIEKMSKILARISVLEKHGYRCRIELFGSFHDGTNNGKVIPCHSVLLKSENQLFDIKRMAFPIAHSAMQRVFGFAWENSLPIEYNSYHDNCLGRAVQYWNSNNREELLNAINERNEKIVFISMKTNLDEVFGKGVIE